MNEINQERFEAWLFAQPKDRVIEASSTGECFVCSFLKETTPIQQPFLTWAKWGVGNGGGNPVPSRMTPLPDWTLALIEPQWTFTNRIRGIGLEHDPISVAQMQARYIELFGPVDTSPLQVGELSASP